MQNRLRKEWGAIVAAKNLVDDMVTYETAPDGRKLDYNAAISGMNKIAATLEGAFDAVTMTKVHIGQRGLKHVGGVMAPGRHNHFLVSSRSGFYDE